MKRAISSLIRHGLTFLGGAGVLSEDEIGQIAGALVALIGIGWSLADKRLAVRAAQMAQVQPQPSSQPLPAQPQPPAQTPQP